MKTDVLLLADVFETFWKTCLKYKKLDPAHFCSLRGLAWEALLKKASENCKHDRLTANDKQVKHKYCELCLHGFRLELPRGIDMLLIFEKGIWSGINQAVKLNAKNNNKYMGEQNNPDNISIYVQYIDENNQNR